MQALSALYRQLDTLFKSSPAAICQIRRVQGELIFEYVNPAHDKLVGRKNISGKKLYDVFPEILQDRTGIYDIIESVATEGKSFRSTALPIYLDWDNSGNITLRYLDISHEPIRNEVGEPEGLVTFAFDVTEHVLLRKQVEEAKLEIENERENFRNLFKQTPEMVCILHGPEHLFEFVNEAHIKVLGRDATGQTVREAQPESVEVHGILDHVYRTGVTAELHEIPVTVGDRLRYFNLTYAARRDIGGNINGVMILGTEVTKAVLARMKIHESEERLRFALSAGSMGTWTVNLSSGAVWLSGESKSLLGLMEVPAGVDATIDSVIHREDREKARNDFEAAIAKMAFYRSEYRILRPLDGALRWILATGNVTYDAMKNPSAFSGIIMDITDRKRYEEGLQHAKEESDRANKLKSAFLANMSHEVRTPLGVVMGFADLLADPNLSPTDRQRYTQILRQSGEQLSVIVNDILDLSKVEAGFMQVETLEFSLYDVIDEVMAASHARAVAKNLLLKAEIESGILKRISSDPVRLKQILMNLLSNAVKFTESGTVTLHVSGGEDQLRFQVTDTGIGISPEQQEKLFKPFTQADVSTTRKFGGTGLGLALSKRLAALLGGDLELESTEVGRGSVFVLKIANRKDLEAVLMVSRKKQESRKKAGTLKNLRVLVVDDSPENQFLLEKILINEGVEVEIAENGLQGVEKALNGNHHLIVMDVQMPVMDGYTATQRLRECGYRKPIIALTAHAMSEARKKCLEVGYSDYLTKPVNSRELISKMDEHSHKLH